MCHIQIKPKNNYMGKKISVCRQDQNLSVAEREPTLFETAKIPKLWIFNYEIKS